MEIDSVSEEKSNKQKAEALQALVNGPLSSSISKLSGSSRVIPVNEDFHFFNNFEEFKTPVKEVSEKSKSMLKSIGYSKCPLGKPFPLPDDSDESHDWLVDLSDEIFERFDASVDEFQRLRNKEEEIGRKINSVDSESGFQLVCRKNKKGFSNDMEKEEGKNLSPLTSVKVSSRDKKTTGARPRVPFHIPTIRRPQDEFKIFVNNFNQPFEHVWLDKSEDGSRVIHPLENLSVLDFVDRSIGDVESVKPLPTESSPFKLIEEVKQLKELANKLRNVNEFAVDLEHNQYRSFQGLTCLMQISTRTEDFVVDTLKLRVHVGPYLREVFKDPSKKKVMHGADRDILWLQRDFGIYVCNLFDTGQASRVLQLERNSLEFLLHHFCGVTANKEYQNADWRLRPLPDEMLRYAREDTHYLLHIFDLMKGRLLSASTSSENGEDLLLEVYKRSCAICMQLYEKELLTDTSYLYIYGLQDADFNSQQLAIAAGLCGWRDAVARVEDESTGYILPNKALLEIARQVPLTAAKLRRLVKSRHPYVEHNLGDVVSIIKSSSQNAYAFEDIAEELKIHAGMASKQNMEMVPDEFEALPASEDPTEMEATPTKPERVNGEVSNKVNGFEHEESSIHVKEEALGMRNVYGEVGDSKKEENNYAPDNSKGSMGATNTGTGSEFLPKAVPEATVQVLKKPNRAFGALLGNTGSKRKLDPNSKDKAEIKVEQIKSSVTLPFHSFTGRNEQSKSLAGEGSKPIETPISTDLVPEPADVTKLEEIISLESDVNNNGVNGDSTSLESDAEDEPMSLSELSNSFQKCFPSKTATRNTSKVERSQESDVCFQLKPFDYASAREHIRFGEDRKQKMETEEPEQGLKSPTDSKGRRRKPVVTRIPTDEEAKEFQQQARRRQAFPQTGNRTTTFR